MGSNTAMLAIVCLVLEAIIFLFVIVGTPIDAFRAKSKSGEGYRVCYSMWGIKECGNHKTNPGSARYKGFPCKKVRNTMNAAAAFSIFSIFLTLVTLVLCILLVCKILGKIAPAILGIVCALTILIVWACQAGAIHQKCGTPTSLSSTFKYAGSFGLMVTAWCLQVINCVLMFLV